MDAGKGINFRISWQVRNHQDESANAWNTLAFSAASLQFLV